MNRSPRILITGVSGFVGQHYLDYLGQVHFSGEVLGLDSGTTATNRADPAFAFETRPLNLLEKGSLESVLAVFRPTQVVHLASISSVAVSWRSPQESFLNNTNIFLNLLEGLRATGQNCRVLSVGSSEEYGRIRPDQLPLREDSALTPESPYAVARVAQEHLSRVYVEGYNMQIVMTRSFNHFGPGQRDQFVVASFVKQFALAKLGGRQQVTLQVGNTGVVRDFLDVRDVVKAYYLLLERGKVGQSYNVCSGNGVSLAHILDILSDLTGLSYEVQVDHALLRPNELPVIYGSNEKLRTEVGWSRSMTLETTLQDTLESWLKVLP
jgi:GDP-4-dehydro-6-deoxy-D-mannose reductase